MTDYYVTGYGTKAYGPMTLDNARVKAVELAQEDRISNVQILGTVEQILGVTEDEVDEILIEQYGNEDSR